MQKPSPFDPPFGKLPGVLFETFAAQAHAVILASGTLAPLNALQAAVLWGEGVVVFHGKTMGFLGKIMGFLGKAIDFVGKTMVFVGKPKNEEVF